MGFFGVTGSWVLALALRSFAEIFSAFDIRFLGLAGFIVIFEA